MSRGMDQFAFSLVAGVEQSVAVNGDWFHVLVAPLAAGVLVRFDDGKQGVYFEGVGIRRRYERITVMSQADQNIVLMLGFGEVSDSRATANVEVATTIAPANENVPLAEVTVTAGNAIKLADANGDRLELRVGIKSAAADAEDGAGVYLGDGTVADNSGGFIEAGQFDYIATNAELWAYNPGAVDIVVNLLELNRVS